MFGASASSWSMLALRTCVGWISWAWGVGVFYPYLTAILERAFVFDIEGRDYVGKGSSCSRAASSQERAFVLVIEGGVSVGGRY